MKSPSEAGFRILRGQIDSSADFCVKRHIQAVNGEFSAVLVSLVFCGESKSSMENNERPEANLRAHYHRARNRVLSWWGSHTELGVMAAVLGAMAIAYILIFQLTRDQTLVTSIASAARNVGAIIPLAILVRYLVANPIKRLSLPAQIVAHIFVGCGVSLAWYTLVLFLKSWTVGWIQDGVTLTPFVDHATGWQLYQGLVIYAGLVAAAHVFILRAELFSMQQTNPKAEPQSGSADRGVFVKSDDEIVRIEPDEIVCISADNDSVWIYAQRGTYTSRRNLKEFSQNLGGLGFLRIHRSHLVNTRSIKSAEPAGDGRLSLHLSNNSTIVTSRAGAKLFRDYISA